MVYVGIYFGEDLEEFKHIWHKFDYALAGVIVLLGIWYVYVQAYVHILFVLDYVG